MEPKGQKRRIKMKDLEMDVMETVVEEVAKQPIQVGRILIGTGVVIGVTTVAYTGYKLLKRRKAAKFEAEVIASVEEDLQVLETED